MGQDRRGIHRVRALSRRRPGPDPILQHQRPEGVRVARQEDEQEEAAAAAAAGDIKNCNNMNNKKKPQQQKPKQNGVF